MPYTNDSLPFSGLTPQSRHASRAGADASTGRALPQAVRYLRALKDRPETGLTDAEASEVMGLQRSTVNARRAPLVKAGLVYSDGFRVGAFGVKNTVWKAR